MCPTNQHRFLECKCRCCVIFHSKKKMKEKYILPLRAVTNGFIPMHMCCCEDFISRLLMNNTVRAWALLPSFLQRQAVNQWRRQVKMKSCPLATSCWQTFTPACWASSNSEGRLSQLLCSACSPAEKLQGRAGAFMALQEEGGDDGSWAAHGWVLQEIKTDKLIFSGDILERYPDSRHVSTGLALALLLVLLSPHWKTWSLIPRMGELHLQLPPFSPWLGAMLQQLSPYVSLPAICWPTKDFFGLARYQQGRYQIWGASQCQQNNQPRRQRCLRPGAAGPTSTAVTSVFRAPGSIFQTWKNERAGFQVPVQKYKEKVSPLSHC